MTHIATTGRPDKVGKSPNHPVEILEGPSGVPITTTRARGRQTRSAADRQRRRAPSHLDTRRRRPTLRSGLHGLEDLGRRQLRHERLAPVGVARQHAFGRAQRVVARLDPAGRTALLDGLDGAEEQAAGLDDRLVGRPEMLLAAVDHEAHALLDYAVRGVDSVYPGER